MKRRIWGFVQGLLAVMLLPCVAGAGSLEPSAAPGPTMKSLDQIPPTWSQKLDSAQRFEMVLDGAGVLDKETGLVWEQNPTTEDFWARAVADCAVKQVGNRYGWRLPTIQELASLVDPTQAGPSLPSGHPFSNVQPRFYWSATTNSVKPSLAWGVVFDVGSGGLDDKTITYDVWCVRGGQGVDLQ